MNAIETNEISLQRHEFQLSDISISIPKHKITTIVGPNGSGKSTFLKIVSRLIKANNGIITVNGKNIHRYKSKEFAKELAMLPQSKEHLPNMTVRELISFGRSPYKSMFKHRLNKEDEEIIAKAMRVTDTTKYKDRLFYSLSGGEQQRVRIAMALAQNTDILLLDEPTTYLDMAHQFEVMELLQTINEEYRSTIVMVLHDLQQAAMYSHFMVAMKKGKVVAEGKPHELLTSEFLRNVYEIDAKIAFKDGYPFIIPNLRGNKVCIS